MTWSHNTFPKGSLGAFLFGVFAVVGFFVGCCDVFWLVFLLIGFVLFGGGLVFCLLRGECFIFHPFCNSKNQNLQKMRVNQRYMNMLFPTGKN